MNPLISASLAEIHRQELLSDAAAARRTRPSDATARGGIRDAMRRLTVVAAVRVHGLRPASH